MGSTTRPWAVDCSAEGEVHVDLCNIRQFATSSKGLQAFLQRLARSGDRHGRCPFGLTASALSAGSANLGNLTDATLRACGSGTCRGADPHLAGACACRTKGRRGCSSRLCRTTPASGAPWDCSSWSWSSLCSGDVVQLVGSEQRTVSWLIGSRRPVGGFRWRSPWPGRADACPGARLRPAVGAAPRRGRTAAGRGGATGPGTAARRAAAR